MIKLAGYISGISSFKGTSDAETFIAEIASHTKSLFPELDVSWNWKDNEKYFAFAYYFISILVICCLTSIPF